MEQWAIKIARCQQYQDIKRETAHAKRITQHANWQKHSSATESWGKKITPIIFPLKIAMSREGDKRFFLKAHRVLNLGNILQKTKTSQVARYDSSWQKIPALKCSGLRHYKYKVGTLKL